MVHPSQLRSYPARRKAQRSVTITTGDRTRSFSIQPWAMALAVGTFVVFSVLYLAATAYLVYRDDLLGGTLARQVGMQYAYEDRIAALRAEIDRVTSRHAVSSQGIGDQLALLLERQTLVERRQRELGVVIDTAEGAGIDVAGVLARLPRSRPERADAPAADIVDPALAYVPSQLSQAERVTGSLLRDPAANGGSEPQAEVKPVLSAVASKLDDAQEQQSLTLDALGAAAQSQADALSSVLAPLGITRNPAAETNPPEAPQGGPFLPAESLHFVEKLSLLSRDLNAVVALRRHADALPLRPPVRAASFSSGFGTRNDPFLHRPAFHAGLDFVAAIGTEVRAAGGGVVISADWNGGYGQMVELRHSGGVTTRYAHLSAILVRVGERVPAGGMIGLVGSTGRSTGPHLHYETRRDGEPVDPAFFLAAGRAL